MKRIQLAIPKHDIYKDKQQVSTSNRMKEQNKQTNKHIVSTMQICLQDSYFQFTVLNYNVTNVQLKACTQSVARC